MAWVDNREERRNRVAIVVCVGRAVVVMTRLVNWRGAAR